MSTIAFIGLGNMGGPMARNPLKSQEQVRVFAVSAKAIDPIVDAGAQQAGTATHAVRAADTAAPPLPRRPPARSGDLHDLVAAAATAARAGSWNPAAERDHEGKTVGQADVREMQDHPPPRSGVGDRPEQAPQAAAGVADGP